MGAKPTGWEPTAEPPSTFDEIEPQTPRPHINDCPRCFEYRMTISSLLDLLGARSIDGVE